MVTLTGGHCVFRLISPCAQKVYLCGDFNEWSQDAAMMERGADGVWVARMDLPPGEYRFRYFVDGRWVNDYAAFGLEPNHLGEWNSVLRVPQYRDRMHIRTAEMARRAAKADGLKGGGAVEPVIPETIRNAYPIRRRQEDRIG